jgi:hypothetical protein
MRYSEPVSLPPGNAYEAPDDGANRRQRSSLPVCRRVVRNGSDQGLADDQIFHIAVLGRL